MCSKVLLPAPDSPTMASISPVITWNDKFSKSTSCELPERNSFLRFCTRNNSACSIRCRIAPYVSASGRKATRLPKLEHGLRDCVSDSYAALPAKSGLNYVRIGRLFVAERLGGQHSGCRP